MGVNFNSTIEDKENLESKIITNHSFISSLKDKFYFYSIISGIYAEIFKVKFNSISSMVINTISSLVNINSSFISNSTMRITQSLLSISSNPNIVFISVSAISARMRALLLGGNVNFQSVSGMIVTMKQNIKAYAETIIYTSSMVVSPNYKKYAVLSFYDPNLLSSLDSNLLQDMDYTVV
jgi:hypothetical protein